MRNWKATNLDMFANPSGFTAWQDRASGLLTSGRQDIRSLLNWAAKCTIPITAAMAHEGARISGLREPIAGIHVILFESIK